VIQISFEHKAFILDDGGFGSHLEGILKTALVNVSPDQLSEDVWEWCESGQLGMEGLIELGYVVWRKEYDEEENLTTEYKIEESPNMLRSLEVDRKCFRDRYPSYTQLSG
jgi:hypothetical protein